MRPTRVFASTFGRVLTIGAAVAAVLAVGSVVSVDGVAAGLRALPVALLVVGGIWALFWRPRVEVSDGGVVLRNVLRTVEVPWPTLLDADARWSFVVRTTDGEHTAWAAPRESAAARRRGDRAGTRSAGPHGPHGPRRAGTTEHATAEAVLAAVRERRDELAAAGHLEGAARAVHDGDLRPTVTRDLPVVVGGAVLVAATVLVAVL